LRGVGAGFGQGFHLHSLLFGLLLLLSAWRIWVSWAAGADDAWAVVK